MRTQRTSWTILATVIVGLGASPEAQGAGKPRTERLLASHVSGVGPIEDPSCFLQTPLDVTATLDELLVAPNASVPVTVVLFARADLTNLTTTVATDGPVVLDQPVMPVTLTGLAKDQSHQFSFSVTHTATGLSSIIVTTAATIASQQYQFTQRIELNCFLRDDRAFCGPEDYLSLQLAAVEEDLRNEDITREDAEELVKELTELAGTHSEDVIPPTMELPAEWSDLPRVLPPPIETGPDRSADDPRYLEENLRGDTCNIRVMGTVLWTDENGNTHPSIGMNVQIRDDDLIGSEHIFTLAPDFNGNYDTGFFCWDDGIGAGDPDIFVRFRTENSAIDVEDGCFLCGTYETDSPINDEFGGGTIVRNFICANTGTGPACSVLDGHTWIAIQTANMNGGSFLDSVRVDWPGDTQSSNYSCFLDRINLQPTDQWDWDTMMHEYGHKIMCAFDMEDNPGGPHSFGDCTSIVQEEKEDGLQIAWGEAWPTYNGTQAQQILNLAALNVPRVGDLNYTDTIENSLNYNIESNSNDVSAPVSGGFGEDNEVAVQRVLWDLWDSANDSRDAWSFGHQALFDVWKNTDITTFSGAWFLLRASGISTNEAELAMGMILVDQGVGPETQSPANNLLISAPGTTFTWLPRVGCDPSFAGNSFTLRFFDGVAPFADRLSIPVGNVTSYMLTQGNFDALAGSGGHLVRWAVDGINTSDPQSGPYLGDNRLLVINQPPTCDIDTPPDAECQGGATTVALQATATDPDGDVLIHTWNSNCPNRTFSDQNAEDTDITIDTFPPCELTCMATLTVFDGFQEATCNVTITVVDTTAPTFAPAPTDETVECDPAVNPAQFAAWLADDAGAVATDTCGTTTIANDSTGLSDGCGATGFEVVTFTAEDQCTNTTSDDARFEVVDTTPPDLFCPAEPIVVQCINPLGIPGDQVVFDVTATDVCGDVEVTDDRPAIFEPSCGGLYPSTIVTFTAEDECGLQSTCEVEVQVKGALCCPGFVDSELTLMSPDLNFAPGGAPITTKAKFDIWNQNEIRFSGTQRCVTCWDSTLLSLYPMPNHFLASNIQTDIGRARIDGVAEPQCPGAVATPLVGVISREVTFAGCPLPGLRSARPLTGRGVQDATIQYAPIDLRSGDDPLRVGPPEFVGMPGENGSLLIWPKVEVRFDFAGQVIRDTFLELTNDGIEQVSFQLYFVNGEAPTDAVVDFGGAIIERAHSGWNFTDQQIVLTPNEPTYWSAHTGLPKGMTPFSNLDGGPPAGRPDPDPRNPGGRIVRGFVVGWAVNVDGREINWNHITAGAKILDYREASGEDYPAWAFDCVSGVADLAECDATPGRLLMDGMEYDAAPEKLLFDFFTPGSAALSHRDALQRFNSPTR
jgi:hypothetical protein